jgi:hypothetical protein
MNITLLKFNSDTIFLNMQDVLKLSPKQVATTVLFRKPVHLNRIITAIASKRHVLFASGEKLGSSPLADGRPRLSCKLKVTH